MNTEANLEKQLTKINPLIRVLRMVGPAVIIAASVIGPGTVTTASSAGATYGYLMLWCVIATPILAYIIQEPCLRWTLHTNTTMLEGVRTNLSPFLAKITFIALFAGALAYQTGNYVGAAMAINLLIPGLSISGGLLILSIVSVIIAFVGRYKIIENFSLGLIIIMLMSFLITMFASRPDIGGIATGMIPNIPLGAGLLALGLVGTTMCPDVPFAMSSLTKRKWSGGMGDFKSAKQDLKLNMVITGVVTSAVIICSAAVLHPQGITVSSAADMAKQLVPVLGRYACVLFALGLWAAGFSSAIYMTSCIPPMMNEAFNLKQDAKSISTRVCVMIIGLFPIIVNFLLGAVPVAIIISAQVLNTFILPLTIVLVAILANKKNILGEHVSSKRQNIAMAVVAVVVLMITVTCIPSVISSLQKLF